MNYQPSLETVRQIAASGDYKVLPVSCDILSDDCTPIQALKKLKNVWKVRVVYRKEISFGAQLYKTICFRLTS